MCDHIVDAMDIARVVIAEVNDQAPTCLGEPDIDRAMVDHVVAVSHPIIQWAAPKGGDAARAIGDHVARLIPNGATIQVGLGTLPDTVLRSLAKKRDLGIHSGIIGDAVTDLMRAGVVNNRRKTIDPGITVTGALLGTEQLYRFAHHNQSLHLRSSRYTHDIETLGAIDRLYGINSALEVDLTVKSTQKLQPGVILD